MEEDINASEEASEEEEGRQMKSNSKALSAPYTIWMTVFIVLPMLLVGYFALTDRGWKFYFGEPAERGGSIPMCFCVLFGWGPWLR